MNIQLIIVVILFAVAVFFTGLKLVRAFGKNKTSGCAGCGSDQVLNTKK